MILFGQPDSFWLIPFLIILYQIKEKMQVRQYEKNHTVFYMIGNTLYIHLGTLIFYEIKALRMKIHKIHFFIIKYDI